MNVFWDFVLIFAALFVEMAFYLMFGLLFVAILFMVMTKEKVVRYLGKENLFSVVKAALLGVPLPLCSCGVVPAAVFLARNGGSKGSVVSFLSSTPQTGVDSIIATYGMMGPVFAVFRPIAAFLTGILSGWAVGLYGKSEKFNVDDSFSSELELNDGEKLSLKEKFKKASRYAFIEFFDDISPQFIVGLIIAALITFFVPDSYFANLDISSGLLGMLLMIAIGAPMYICATGSIPIAMSLMMKGFSPGVAFVFLAVGPATNAASFAILMKVLGKKTAIIYLLILSVSSIGFGYLLEFIFMSTGINPMQFVSTHHHEMNAGAFEILKYIVSIVFLVLVLSSLYRVYLKKYFRKNEKDDSMNIITVDGMNCNHCAMNVRNAISKVEGVTSVEVDLATNTAKIDGNFDISNVVKEIEAVGYSVKK